MYPYLEFYKTFFPAIRITDSEEIAVKCCFHNDHQPSLYLNVKNGTYHCKVCDEEATGGAADWLQQFYQIRIYDALNIVEDYQQTGKLSVPANRDKIITMHNTLMDPSHAVQLKEFMQKRMMMKDTIVNALIGYDDNTERYSIPVPAHMPDYYRGEQHYMTVRYYGLKKPANPNAKFSKMIYKRDDTKGFSKAYFFPVNQLNAGENELFLFEGETDALLARQFGIPALTTTGGVNSWPKEGKTKHDKYDNYDMFSGYDKVYVIMDDDEPGNIGANKIALKILAHNPNVFVCSYNSSRSGYDFTDFVQDKFREGIRRITEIHDAFINEIILDSATKFESIKGKLEKQNEQEIEDMEADRIQTTFNEVVNARHLHNKNVLFTARMGAVLNKRMTVPKRIRLFVNYYDEDQAISPATDIGKLTEEELREGIELEIPVNDSILSFVGKTVDNQVHQLKIGLSIAPTNNMYQIEVLEHYYVSIAQLVPKADEMTAREDDSTVTYILQGDDIPVGEGETYEFKALKTVDPGNAAVTLLVTDYKKAFDDIEGFSPTAEELQELKIFQVAEGQSVAEKMKEIATDLTHVTRIWGREDIIISYDLVYHSALKFKFGGKRVDRGWLDILVIGDSRTGKTETAERLQTHYQLGEKFTAESASIAGLTGGVDTVAGPGGNGKHMIRWGKFPLNDKRLLVVDEMSGLDKDDIGKLSNIRSQGIVEISKIVGNSARARVRTIWISNPRNGNGGNSYLSDKQYGVQAIVDLIGASEDIARFDFAMGVGQDDVSSELVNDPTLSLLPETPEKYSRELCHRLILWSWSRNLADQSYDDVVFADGVEAFLLQQAQEITSLYRYNQAMLIDISSFKEKLARVSIATAARVFSTDETFSKIIVKQEHVQFAIDFLDRLYSSSTLRYKALAVKERAAKQVTNEQAVKMIKVISRMDSMYNDKISTMLDVAGHKLITENALMLATGISEIETARDTINSLEEVGIVEVQYGASAGKFRASRKWAGFVYPIYIVAREEHGKDLTAYLENFSEFAY